MVGPQQISFGEVTLLFICQEHSVFYSYRFNEYSLFLELRLIFDFHFDLCSDLVISFYQGVFFLPLVHVGFHRKSCYKKFEWCGKEKKLYAKKWYKKELVYTGGALLGQNWAMARPCFFAKKCFTRIHPKAQHICLVCRWLSGPSLAR
jgi:hypothetical protein